MANLSEIPTELSDAAIAAALDRLYRLNLYCRWLVVAILWLTLGAGSLWALRDPIGLLRDYFTWAAVRYGLVFHPLAALGLVVCFVLTLSALLWQIQFMLWGISRSERQRLERKVFKIWKKGQRHPLWRFVFQ